MWITIRKKFMNANSFIENIDHHENSSELVKRKVEGLESEYKALEESHKKLADAYNNLREEF